MTFALRTRFLDCIIPTALVSFYIVIVRDAAGPRRWVWKQTKYLKWFIFNQALVLFRIPTYFRRFGLLATGKCECIALLLLYLWKYFLVQRNCLENFMTSINAFWIDITLYSFNATLLNFLGELKVENLKRSVFFPKAHSFILFSPMECIVERRHIVTLRRLNLM